MPPASTDEDLSAAFWALTEDQVALHRPHGQDVATHPGQLLFQRSFGGGRSAGYGAPVDAPTDAASAMKRAISRSRSGWGNTM